VTSTKERVMLSGVNRFLHPGSNQVPGLQKLAGIPERAERLVDRFEARQEAGKLDGDKLAERLEARFGEAAEGIVGEDGAVDFERLEALIVETRSAELQGRLTERFGEDALGIVGADGSIDTDRLEELFAERRLERIFDRLEKRFGEDFAGVVADGGSIDFAALKALLAGTPAAEAGTTDESVETAAVAESEAAYVIATAMDAEETGDEAAATESDGDTAVSAVDQLAELRRILFQDILQDRFGDAAETVLTEDGEVDVAALRELFEDRGSARFAHPGLGHGAFAFGASILDFSA